MSWLFIADGRHALVAPEDGAGGLVASGSLVVETSFAAAPERSQTLVHLRRVAGWDREFRMTLRADGELFVEHRQNRAVTCALLRITSPSRDAALRVTYSWDGPARQGMLSVETLDDGRLDQALFDDPLPWPMDDIAALTGDECRLDPGLSLLAVSDRIAAVAVPPGLGAGTLVETAAGLRPVQELERGDLVLTAESGYQPVRWTVSRELPAAGRFAPILLHAPFFGLRGDILLAPEHRILIEGADAEYLFGSDAVLVEARHLAGVSGGWSARPAPTMTFVQMILDRHACISAGGTWVETLFMGDPAERPLQLGGAGLSAIPDTLLPRHRRIAGPQLKPYEAVVLVSALCA